MQNQPINKQDLGGMSGTRALQAWRSMKTKTIHRDDCYTSVSQASIIKELTRMPAWRFLTLEVYTT